MNIRQNLTSVNKTSYNNRKIEYLVVHYFGALGTAKNTCAYFKSANRQASAHYFVDENEIWQAVLDKDASWHCGDSGRGTHKGLCTNANSIGIEVRPYKLSTATMLATDKDWYFTKATEDNLVALVKDLMKRYNIPIDNVIRHYDVTGKLCPRPWAGTDRNSYYSEVSNVMWDEFKARLVVAEGPSAWAEEAIAWASAKGISDGSRPKDTATREEIITMLWRALK